MRPSSDYTGSRLGLLLFYRMPVLALCGFIFWQSSYPGIVSDPLFPFDDKVFHFMAYSLLSWLCARNLLKEKPDWSLKKIAFTAILFSSLYGLTDELHQAFVPERQASALDFIADCAGSVAGCLAYLKLAVLRKPPF